MKLELIPFRPELADDFRSINEEWITEMFSLEDGERGILADPRGQIVDRGGCVLFVGTSEHGIVGTGALIRTGDGEFELSKMGVRKSARGLKAGEFLLRALIRKAEELGARKLYLLTNRKCEAAIHLYEKAGFVHDAETMEYHGRRYSRCNVAMSYPLPQAGS